jgi:hypothetical protein
MEEAQLMPSKTEGRVNYLKLAFSLILAGYGIACAKAVPEGSFLDGVNLISHEAGHLLFGYFGEFLHVLGGTLGQLLVPTGMGIYFATRGELYSAVVAAFWFGQNMLGISVYAKDAAAMELPLVSIGGGDAIHDWNYLLLKFNVLAHDQLIGNLIYCCGVVIMTAAILASFRFSYQTVSSSLPPLRS